MKRSLSLPELFDRLSDVVYPALLEAYRPDCCIAAAAILTRVFDHFGYRANVIPVSVEIYNAAMLKAFRANVNIPPASEPAKREMFFELTGAWGIGIFPGGAVRDRRGRPGYGGHLLVYVERFLVDATIKQAERPEKNVILPNMIVVGEAADRLVRQGSVSLQVGDCAIRYKKIDNESYRTAPDWTRRTTPFPETVRRILSRVDEPRREMTGT
jgi:hypothetical protein